MQVNQDQALKLRRCTPCSSESQGFEAERIEQCYIHCSGPYASGKRCPQRIGGRNEAENEERAQDVSLY